MQFEIGIPTILEGDWYELKTRLYALSSQLQKQCRKILIIDTMNSLNPHHFAYNHVRQKDIFNNIYCVRCPKAFDLLARVQSMEGFLEKKRIEAVIVTSLTLIFADNEQREIAPLIHNIMEKLADIAKRHRLVLIIGKSPQADEKVQLACKFLEQMPLVR